MYPPGYNPPGATYIIFYNNRREFENMKKIKNTKGFTLMEMLIVVAIIAILIAIAIPTFTAQLEKARQAADIANAADHRQHILLRAQCCGALQGNSSSPTK